MSKFNDLCTCISDLQRMIDQIDGTDFGKLEKLFDEMKKTADKASDLSDLFDGELDLRFMPEVVEALDRLLNVETYSLNVGYGMGSGGGNYVYTDVIRTDDEAFDKARAAVAKARGEGA